MTDASVATHLIIRTATVAEQKTLEALQWRASLTNAGDRDALLANPDAINISLDQLASGRVFVAELRGVTVGFSAIEPREDGETELDALFVEPTFRRRGIARLMVDHCGEVARKRNSAALHVTGNPHAMDFYLSYGFEELGTIQTRFGPGVLMKKRL